LFSEINDNLRLDSIYVCKDIIVGLINPNRMLHT
jgi:hypothetical protein